MSKAAIPSVRAWRVRFYDQDKLLADIVVDTINKRFARWMANERAGYPAIRSTRVVVSLLSQSKTIRRLNKLADQLARECPLRELLGAIRQTGNG